MRRPIAIIINMPGAATPIPIPTFAPVDRRDEPKPDSADVVLFVAVGPAVAVAPVEAVATAVAGAVEKSVDCQRISTPYAFIRPVSSNLPVYVASAPPEVVVKLYVVNIFASGLHWQISLVYQGNVSPVDGRVEYVFPTALSIK